MSGTVCVRCKREVFSYQVIPGEGDVCFTCAKRGRGDRRLTTFPFTTTHITGDGSPVEVQSLRHLRKLEAEYGVQSGAYN